MRRFLVAICACLIAFGATMCSSKPHPTAQKGRIIAVTGQMIAEGGTDTIRIGHLRSGEIAVVRFSLRNDSDRPFVLLDYGRNCGCATLEYEHQPVAQGAELPLTLTFDSRGEYGWQLKTLDLKLSGAAKPIRLFVEADVE